MTRKIEAIDDGSEGLLYSYSGYDEKDRRLYTVYCQPCKHLSFYRLSLFGGTATKPAIDARAFYSKVREGRIPAEEMSVIGANIQLAMIEDRVLPPRWELI